MSNNKRLFLSLSEEDVARLDSLREELGMNRSQYVRYLISGQRKQLCPSIKYRDAVERLANIDLSLRTIVLKENMSEEDRLMSLAKEAGAVYKVGNSALINTEIFESYLEKFREPSRPLPAHIWNDKNKHRISVQKK